MTTINSHFLSETSIKKEEQDLFEFKHYAKKVQVLIQLNSNNNDPFTIGVYGKWGEGKTSFLNLVTEKIDHFEKKEGDKEYYTFEFNPWRYSTEDEMLFDFFDSLAKRFFVEKKEPLQKVGEQIKKYSKYLKAIKISSTVGIPKILNTKIEFEPNEIFKALGEDLAGEEITLEELKKKVNEAINKANFKIVVVIDDIDRLDKDEIYTILKLIKLNANFNNFIFIVALDFEHTAKAIKDKYGNDIEDGKLFLEKIINIPIYLPKIENSYLNKYFDTKLNEVFKNLQLTNKDEVFSKIRNSFYQMDFNSPREIIRLLNSFFISAFALYPDIDLEDLFWMEWIKIKHYQIYNDLKKVSVEFFHIPTNQLLDPNFNSGFEIQIKSIVEKYNHLPILKDLFSTNREQNNISNISVRNPKTFDRYFSFHIGDRTPQYLLDEIIYNYDMLNNEGIIPHLVDLLKREDGFYKLLELINHFNKKEIKNRNHFYLAIIKNLTLIPVENIDMFGNDNRIRVLETIANILSSDENNSEISIKIAKELDVEELCYFTRKFKDNIEPKNGLEQIIVEKAKSKFNTKNPIYISPSNPIKMIMHYWVKYDKENFDNHIKTSLTTLDKIKKLIRNFPPYFNNSFYGGLMRDNYEYMKKFIDVDFLYSKIIQFRPDLASLEFSSNYVLDDTIETSEEDNLEQFIYWYKKDKEQNNNE